jgi:hypothetical protein
LIIHDIADAAKSGVHLLSNGLPGQQELVKRWLQEIQDALKSKARNCLLTLGLDTLEIVLADLLHFLKHAAYQCFYIFFLRQIVLTALQTGMVQYHALGLLALLRQHDKLSLSKLVLTMTRAPIRAPYTHCLLIRLAAKVSSAFLSCDQ